MMNIPRTDPLQQPASLEVLLLKQSYEKTKIFFLEVLPPSRMQLPLVCLGLISITIQSACHPCRSSRWEIRW